MNNWIRQFHRWVSVAFAATVIMTTIALPQKEPATWVSYLPLAPLALLAVTGLCLFVLPYVARRRSRQE